MLEELWIGLVTMGADVQDLKEGERCTRLMCPKGGQASTEEVGKTEGMVRRGGNPYRKRVSNLELIRK